MTTFEANLKGIWGKLVYAAVPLEPPLLDVIKETEINKHIVPWPPGDINAEAYSSHITIDNILTHVTLSVHRGEVKTSELFPTPKVWPRNHTSLQVAATSSSKDITDQIVKDTLGLWKCTKIYICEDRKPYFQQGMLLYLQNHAYSSIFFDKYQLLRRNLTDVIELPDIKAPEVIDKTYRSYPIFIKQPPINDDHAIWLTHRVRGKARDIPIEAALIYIGGSRFLGLYGLMLYTKYEKGKFEENVRSATGFVLRTDLLHVGCTKIISDKNIPGADSPDLFEQQQQLGLFCDYIPVVGFNRDTVPNSNLRRYDLDLNEVTELARFLMKATKE